LSAFLEAVQSLQPEITVIDVVDAG